jgi:DNA processing protein
MTDSTVYWVLLSSISGIGPKRFRALLEVFGSPHDVLAAERSELERLSRITPDTVDQMREALASVDGIRQQLGGLEEEGIDVWTWEDDAYPHILKTIPDPPPVLYVRGHVTAVDEEAIAIVGSRDATPAALQFAHDLAEAAVAEEFTVVSGFAQGVDGAAHAGALQAGGRTLAVLGSGIRVIFPKQHWELAQQVIASGAMLSELAPNARPSGPTLMARDRIISGLSRGVVVVQATEKSGTMDTAARAEKQGRPLFAVDWPDDGPEFSGNRYLLARGAHKLTPRGQENLKTIREVLDGAAAEQQQNPEQKKLF